jgi:hypothetical protein
VAHLPITLLGCVALLVATVMLISRSRVNRGMHEIPSVFPGDIESPSMQDKTMVAAVHYDECMKAINHG